MSRYLLDTNIVSNLAKPTPSETLAAWMSEQPDEALFISALSLAEVWRGILLKPRGRKRRELEAWFDGPKGPSSLFSGRILAFDAEAGLIWARLMAEGSASGRPRDPLDMIIASVGERHDCVIVTDNERHFHGIAFINPIRGG